MQRLLSPGGHIRFDTSKHRGRFSRLPYLCGFPLSYRIQRVERSEKGEEGEKLSLYCGVRSS